jgi:hypothetical protein
MLTGIQWQSFEENVRRLEEGRVNYSGTVTKEFEENARQLEAGKSTYESTAMEL